MSKHQKESAQLLIGSSDWLKARQREATEQANKEAKEIGNSILPGKPTVRGNGPLRA